MKKEIKAAYPIVLTQYTDGITVFVPDFNINTEGDSIVNAIEMARDAIGLMGIDYQQDGKDIPTPSDIKQIKTKNNELLSFVDIDFNVYRKMNKNSTEEKIAFKD